MDDYRWGHIPAFGSWDYSDDLPITQYFESARQAGLLRYRSGELDLYKSNNLYGEDLKIPVRTVVSRRKTKGTQTRYSHGKEERKEGKVCNCNVTEPLKRHVVNPNLPRQTRAPKAVDEDLYKIPPEFLTNSKRKKMLGFFSRCLLPTCDA